MVSCPVPRRKEMQSLGIGWRDSCLHETGLVGWKYGYRLIGDIEIVDDDVNVDCEDDDDID